MHHDVGRAPYLAKLSESSWHLFVEDLDAYRARGGRLGLRSLVAPLVMDMLKDQGIELGSDDAAAEAAALARISDNIFAPASVVEAHARFRQLRARNSGHGMLQDVLDYGHEWVRAVRVCPEATRPSERVLIGLYVAGLPAVLRDGVRLREPESLGAARKLALDQVRSYREMCSNFPSAFQGVGGLEAREPVRARVGGVRDSASGPAGAPSRKVKGFTCFTCGERGHRAADCRRASKDSRSIGGSVGLRADSDRGGNSPPVAGQPRRVESVWMRPLHRDHGHATRAATGALAAKERHERKSLAIALAGALGEDAVVSPKFRVRLVSEAGEQVEVAALFDTGSDTSLMSPALRNRLLDAGGRGAAGHVQAYRREQSLRTAGGRAQVDEWLRCCVLAGGEDRVPLDVGVLDVGEDLLLGFPFLRRSGLLSWLTADTSADVQRERPSLRQPCQRQAVGEHPGLETAREHTVAFTEGVEGAPGEQLQPRCHESRPLRPGKGDAICILGDNMGDIADAAHTDGQRDEGQHQVEDAMVTVGGDTSGDEELFARLSPIGSVAIDGVASATLQRRVRELLDQYADLFGDLPAQGACVQPMTIDLKPGAEPAASPPRRMSPAIRKVVSDEVGDLLRQGIIVPSTSPFSAPVVVVKKKTGDYRMCVDYRAVNSCTIPMRFPMPNTRDVLDRLAGQQFFAKLDLRSGFHQMPLEPAARQYTAFATNEGLFEYTRVPFGLRNAPPFFQRAMTQVLQGLTGVCCEVFIDDVVIYGDSEESFAMALARVFERLRLHQLRLKAAKCEFALSAVEYLGHVVSGRGVTLSGERREAVAQVAVPTTKGKLKSFLGMANFFRPFVRNFAQVAAPLHALCSPKQKFEWATAHQEAFEQIRDAIVDAPLLAHVDYARDIYLRTDASEAGVGGMLYQKDDEGGIVPVCFVSRKFTGAEVRWSTIEQECFGIYHCIVSLSHYLLGQRFIVETDHRNLLFIEKSTAPKVVRWRLRLEEFDFELRHVPGRENEVADALSRCLPVRRVHDIERVHNDVVGHRGIRKTVDLLREAGVEWDGMLGDVTAFVRACPICQKVRNGTGSAAAAMRTTIVHRPFEVIAVDTVGPFPVDDAGNSYIVVMEDCFSRFVELFAAPDASAESAARALLAVFGRYGPPAQLRSDNGAQYTARIIDELLRRVGATRQLTIEYRPQSNGLVERANAEVLRHLRAIVMTRRLNARWSDQLPLVQRIINATPHAAIGTTPARVLYGDAVNLDRRLLRDDPAPADDGQAVAVEAYVQRLNAAQRDIVAASDRYQQQVVDRRLAGQRDRLPFGEGDYVLASYPARPPSKLAPKWRGPFLLVEINGSTGVCQDLGSLRLVRFHLSRLRKYDASMTDDPVALAAVDTDEYVVEAIIDHRGNPNRRSTLEFLVRWLGYEPEEDMWLPWRNVKELAALDVYAAAHPELRL